MPRFRAVSRVTLLCAAVLAVAGCKNSAQLFEDNNEGGWFSKKADLFARPEWAVASVDKNADLSPRSPVDANELVGADGRCGVVAPAAPEPAQAAAPAAPADRAVGSVAGDLAGAPMPAAMVSAYPNDSTLRGGEPTAPQVMGGIALGMTECQTVARAGLAGNVAINAGGKGERQVVLTYLTGTWPGIYHFSDGRLRQIDRAPAPPEPAKKQKAKKTVKPKTAASQAPARGSVQ